MCQIRTLAVTANTPTQSSKAVVHSGLLTLAALGLRHSRTIEREIAVEASQADMWFLQSTESANSAYPDCPLHGGHCKNWFSFRCKSTDKAEVLGDSDWTRISNNVAFVTGYD